MAITGPDTILWKLLGERNLIPANGRMIEIGEANWYGDVDATDHVPNPPPCPFRTAAKYWDWVVRPSVRHAIDLHGTPRAFKLDMNVTRNYHPDGRYDLLVNTGTLEHVFDQHAAWKNCHDMTKPGGLMVHNLPWLGWHHHGLYNYQPGFVIDLAKANGYKIELLAYSTIKPLWFWEPMEDQTVDPPGKDVMIHAALRKVRDSYFEKPMQSCYFNQRA